MLPGVGSWDWWYSSWSLAATAASFAIGPSAFSSSRITAYQLVVLKIVGPSEVVEPGQPTFRHVEHYD